MRTLGQIAYEAFCHRGSTQQLTFVPWKQLDTLAQVRWQFAGEQIRVAIANAIAHGEAL